MEGKESTVVAYLNKRAVKHLNECLKMTSVNI